MGAFDWLFGGQVPPSVTSTVQQEPGLPTWYQDILRGTVGKASALGDVPYTGYTGERLAGLTADQTAAFDKVRGLDTRVNPLTDFASNRLMGTEGASSLGAAQPYFDRAGETFTGDSVDRYMNPYIDNVTDRIAELGNRNLTERILPSVNDMFISSGQPGSTRHADFTSRAIRDATGEIAGKQGEALAAGYGQAGQMFGADAARAAQLGTSAGGLSGLDTQTAISAAQQGGNLANTLQQLGIKGAAAQEAAGAAQQQQQQQGLDINYGNFLEQRQYPYQQVGFVSDVLKGTPQPSQGLYQTTTAPYAGQGGPSALGQIAGAGVSLAGLLGLGKKRGGLIHLRRAA